MSGGIVLCRDRSYHCKTGGGIATPCSSFVIYLRLIDGLNEPIGERSSQAVRFVAYVPT